MKDYPNQLDVQTQQFFKNSPIEVDSNFMDKLKEEIFNQKEKRAIEDRRMK